MVLMSRGSEARAERGRISMRFPQRSLSLATEAGFTPAEVLNDAEGGARTHSC